VPCPKGIELEAGHGQLGNLEALSVLSWLLDSIREILDGIVVKLAKDNKAHNHLFVIEGFGCRLAK
jgi:hypothetical protein